MDADLLDVVSMEFLVKPSSTRKATPWMDPIVTYLKTGEHPKDKTKAQILQLKVARYVLYDDKLYRIGYSMLLLKCATPLEVKYIMREIHEGTCRNHPGG